MTAQGRVEALYGDGRLAGVKVVRQSGCASCKACSFRQGCADGLSLGGNEPVLLRAVNRIDAQIGDLVEVSSPSGRVLGCMAALFVLPLLAAFAAYGAGMAFHLSGGVIGALVGAVFMIVFAGSAFLLNRVAPHYLTAEITKILDTADRG